MLAVNGHAKHRQSLCRVGYGKTALSMDLFFITTAKVLSTHTFLLLSLNFLYAARDLWLQNSPITKLQFCHSGAKSNGAENLKIRID